jgi:hypothetical protein
MIICPACRHLEMAGTIFCSECGALVISRPEEYSQSIGQSGGMPERVRGEGLSQTRPPTISPVSKAVKILSTGQVLPLTGKQEFTLGRAGCSQPILPDIDLTPYGGYQNGVSRLHALVKIKDKIVWVIDLGSANGTRVNGLAITAHEPVRIQIGDVITLGNFDIQIID